jgi:hypothetical protein
MPWTSVSPLEIRSSSGLYSFILLKTTYANVRVLEETVQTTSLFSFSILCTDLTQKNSVFSQKYDNFSNTLSLSVNSGLEFYDPLEA